MPKNTKPHIALACICERVLREEDGVLSVIRIVDTIRIQAIGAVAPGAVPAVTVTALVSLKSGDFEGRGDVSLRVRDPSGRTSPVGSVWPIVMKGDEHGANIIVQMAFAAQNFGLYKLDVYWDNDVLTTIPIKLAPPPDPVLAES